MTGYFESLCVVDSDTEESDDWIQKQIQIQYFESLCVVDSDTEESDNWIL